MKYFLDQEFISGFHKPLFGKKRHFIDLISIGIVCEDGRKFYQLSCEYNYNDADDWVKENVILPLYKQTVSGDGRNRCTVENFHKFYGLTNKQIATGIIEFCKCGTWNNIETIGQTTNISDLKTRTAPEFYGYYADYDWVLFCSLFGRMIDLPSGFPMYCKDLKQMLDEKIESKNWYYGRDCWSNTGILGEGDLQADDRIATFDEKLNKVKSLSLYPKQANEHNALDDAKWNFELYKFLNSL